MLSPEAVPTILRMLQRNGPIGGVSQPGGAPPSPSGIKPKDIGGERMNEKTDRKLSDATAYAGP
jgi:hypothetical protein